MKLFSLLFALFLPFLATALDDISSIRGYAEDKQTGGRIKDAMIVLKLGKKEISRMKTLEDGEFIFEHLAAGLYDLECTATGYVTQRIVGLELKEDRVKLAYFSLRAGDTEKFGGPEVIYTYAALQAQLEAKVTTASRNEESAANAPASIYVVTQEDISQRGYQTLSELMEDIPGVEVNERTSPEDYNTITIRGIFGNNKLVILVNGIRLSPFSTESIPIDKQFNIRHARRVEVLIGPASAVYGADAFMGVVNIITQEGKYLQGGDFLGSYGMYHTTQNSFVAGAYLGDFQLSTTGSIYHSAEPNLAQAYPDDFSWYNNQYSQNGLMLCDPLDSSLTDTLPIQAFSMQRWAYSFHSQIKYKSLEVGYAHNQLMYSSSVGERPEYSLYWKESKHGYALHTAYAKHLLAPTDKKWSLESTVAWNLYVVNRRSASVSQSSDYRKTYEFGHSQSIRLDENFAYQFSEKHRLAAGLQFQYSDILPNMSNLPQPFGKIKDSEQTLYYVGSETVDSLKLYQRLYRMQRFVGGFFAQYQGNFSDKLFVSLGLRLDYILDVDAYALPHKLHPYTTFNPRLGLIYNPVEALRIKLFYGEAFLTPNGDLKFENYGKLSVQTDSLGVNYLVAGLWHVKNENLIPEKNRSMEFVLDYSKGNLHFSGLGFFSFSSEIIQKHLRYNVDSIEGIPIPISQIYDNEANQLTYGAIAQFDYRLFLNKKEDAELKFRANYAFTSGVLKEVHVDYPGDALSTYQLPFVAAHTAKLGITFRYKGFSLNVNGVFRSKTINEGEADATGAVTQLGNKAFYVIHSNIGYTLKVKKVYFDFFAKVQNVTNNRYYHTATNTVGNFVASPQDPIRLVGGVMVGFTGR